LKRPALGSVLRWCDIAAGGETCTMASRNGAAARPEVALASFTTTLKDTSTLRGLLNATECGVTARNAIVALRTGSSMKVGRGVVGGRGAQSISRSRIAVAVGFIYTMMKRMREKGTLYKNNDPPDWMVDTSQQVKSWGSAWGYAVHC
jgi:hypothetical protein